MPGMNGLEFAKMLAGSSKLPDIPFVMLSSCDKPVSSAELRSHNIQRFLMKPARESMLHDALVKVLSNSAHSQSDNAPETESDDIAAETIDKTKIMVAEDFPLNQDVIRLMLSDSDFEAEFVGNGKEAVTAFANQPGKYAVILMDISMPVMDGYQASQAIAEFESKNGLAHTPIIALTGHALKNDRERCLAAGMNDYLSKPVRQELLLSKLEEWSANSAAVGAGDANILLTG